MGYTDAENGITPAHAGVGHRQGWFNGYNYGYLATSVGNILQAEGDRKTFKKVLIIVTNIPKQLTLKASPTLPIL